MKLDKHMDCLASKKFSVGFLETYVCLLVVGVTTLKQIKHGNYSGVVPPNQGLVVCIVVTTVLQLVGLLIVFFVDPIKINNHTVRIWMARLYCPFILTVFVFLPLPVIVGVLFDITNAKELVSSELSLFVIAELVQGAQGAFAWWDVRAKFTEVDKELMRIAHK